jgi:hypothetical protein
MIDLISKLNAGVKDNSTKNIYKIPYLDSLNLHNFSKIISVNGSNDTLKTRFCLYLAKNILLSGGSVLYVAASQESLGMLSLEMGKAARNLPIVFENNIDRLETMLNALPAGSHVFIDSIIGVFTAHPKFQEMPYLYLGKMLNSLVVKKRIYFYIQSGYNGFSFTPHSKIFSDVINLNITIKKVKSPVKELKKIGSLYQNKIVGFYYLIKYEPQDGKSFSQLCYGDLNTGLKESMFNFFHDYAIGAITKVKNTYYHNGEILGSKLRPLLESYKN